ncbi:NAD(P)H-hydrate epimerase [Sinanaerobacter chloroacetimidivorans]|uniref:NAD(P)H-hydrate epimerase n=1 Tax=Sinanaerobacter chloroacetimidivorans TaxID=2818044 RepID=A0A8J7W3X9_9FIRM|nr:NAD(P)H-hydrate epimerase [Sinanaerobacter chloroacetimidivorans]MBR0599916.1 NAD(P)H-hydrate epimerase [Sinanaerobacter chloroacetimidivorans]
MAGITQKEMTDQRNGQLNKELNGQLGDEDVITSAEMKEIERKAAEGGLSYYQMMENAGTAASDFILGREEIQGKRVLVFCGRGNNGGDGFVAARKLSEGGGNVTLVLVDGEPKTEDAVKNKKLCDELSIPVIDLTSAGEADIIVEAIYGTGYHGKLKESAREAAKLINRSFGVIYALDVPSGLNGDTGEADPDTVIADHTIVFHRCKPAHRLEKAQRYCGKILCVDIGIS